MLFSRWKVMTGVIGISVGGLAALAGQNPKPEVVASAPMIPAAKPMATPASTELPALPVDLLPALPTVPHAAPSSVKPASKPTTIELPTLPLAESKPQEVKPPSTKGFEPAVLPVGGVSSIYNLIPDSPPIAAPIPIPSKAPTGIFTPPTANPSPTVPSTPPITITSVETPVVDLLPPATPKPVAVAIPSKFRIVLRVGEGEPTFEVRHNDDLVMKVACDKVDIKSPEKGTGPSNVIATGKVRFVGFGAEGTCDSLSFLSGTGEVSLAGNVNVKVRDKIGRVESELNADKMQYKLDSTALTGVLKP